MLVVRVRDGCTCGKERDFALTYIVCHNRTCTELSSRNRCYYLIIWLFSYYHSQVVRCHLLRNHAHSCKITYNSSLASGRPTASGMTAIIFRPRHKGCRSIVCGRSTWLHFSLGELVRLMWLWTDVNSRETWGHLLFLHNDALLTSQQPGCAELPVQPLSLPASHVTITTEWLYLPLFLCLSVCMSLAVYC